VAADGHAMLAATEEHALAERAKTKGAVRTDFVLSAEIVTIKLGSIPTAPLVARLLAWLVRGVEFDLR
jgi:predicted DNA repair protein MutK